MPTNSVSVKVIDLHELRSSVALTLVYNDEVGNGMNMMMYSLFGSVLAD